MAAVLAVGVLTLAGCSDESEPEPSPTSTSATPVPSTSPASATSSPSASVPEGFSLDAVSSPTFPDLGGDLGSTGVVRVGHHTGYDRVVWEFAGTGAPSYSVKYVDEPLGDGSGDPVAVRGDAYVEVLITSVGIPSGGTSRPPDVPASALSGTVIAEAMAIFGGFEGYGQAFIGVRDRQRPLRVDVLTDPTRLVVDIANG
jgi:hypothetical protein